MSTTTFIEMPSEFASIAPPSQVAMKAITNLEKHLKIGINPGGLLPKIGTLIY